MVNFRINDGVLEKYSGDESEIRIPEGVEKIGDSAFSWCRSLTSVIIPESVTTIGNSAFEDCSRLTSVSIPESVTTIGNSAFEDCSGLTSVSIPRGVIEIGYSAFKNCSRLTSVNIPEGVNKIGSYAFSRCSSLTSISIPESVEEIGNCAFMDCSSLTCVNIPEGVEKIESGTFYGCRSLTSINISEGAKKIGESAFSGCSSLTSISIPEGVKEIGESAFSGCSSLTRVNIPESVNKIGSYAFYGCRSLTSINISEGAKKIGESAFSGCSSLTSISIPEGVKEIGESAFSGCSSLTRVNIPESVNKIGSYAFSRCSSLTSVNIPEGVKEIGESAFEHCSSLTSVNLPEGVRKIGWRAFEDCSGLTSINIPESVNKIGSYAFSRCSSLTSVNIPEGVKEIGESAFEHCSSLTSVNIPESAMKIGRRAFKDCSSLTSINLPEGLSDIRRNIVEIFKGCTKLLSGLDNDEFFIISSYLVKYNGNKEDVIIPNETKDICDNVFAGHKEIINVTFPAEMKDIGSGAFKECSSLTSINIPEGVIEIGYSAFKDCSSLTSISIPEGLSDIRRNIVEIFKGCTKLLSGLDNDEFFIISSYLVKYNGNKEDVIIPNETKDICDNVFAGHKEIINVTFPAEMKDIGSGAFKECSSLTSVNLPEGVKGIGSGAFRYCSSLTSVNIPEGVKEIGESAFEHCSRLTSVNIPEGVIKIGYSAFKDCSSLTSISIPEGVKEIGESVFYGCSGLTSISIPEGVEEIGNCAFMDCSSLTSVSIPKNVRYIGDSSFLNCKNLSEISIPEGVFRFDISVFSGCEKLEKIVIENKKCKIIWDPDYGDSPYDLHLTSQIIESIYPLVPNQVLIEFVLLSDIWAGLSPEAQTDIFLTRRSKAVRDLYHFDQPEIIGEIIVKRLAGKLTSKTCEAAASFVILYYTLIPKELTEEIYNGLKSAKKGVKAVRILESDQAFMKFSNEITEETKYLPVEKKVMEILMAQKISLKAPEFNLNRYFSLDPDALPTITDPEGKTVSAFVLSWLFTAHEGWESWGTTGGNCYEIRKEPGICPEAGEVVGMLDPESFQSALGEIADRFRWETGKILDLAYPVCRYADEKTMEDLTKRAPKYWVSATSGINAPAMRAFRRAAKYSTTRAALLFAEKYDDLDDYAEIRGMDVDAVRDQIIAHTGLDADRSKTYDLGNQTVKVRLRKDLSFIVELPDGKTAKSLPKKNADPEKYAAANEDFSGLKKSIKKIIKSRISSLFDDFLSGRTRNAESWKGSFLGNPLLRDIASLLVWQQGQNTFTLTESDIIDSAGNQYSITDEEICLAYPAEMDARDLTAWQDHFTTNHLKQPFLQLWEPVRNLSEIKPDRYKGDKIPFYRFLHQEKHGISVSWDYHGYSYECPFTGCSGSIERVTGWRSLETDDLFEVRDFKPHVGSRYANHIVTYLDRITIWERIRKDDTQIIDLLPQFTAAQISEFISIAAEAHAVNVTAMLMEYKNAHYPDLDPLAEFTLDFL